MCKINHSLKALKVADAAILKSENEDFYLQID